MHLTAIPPLQLHAMDSNRPNRGRHDCNTAMHTAAMVGLESIGGRCNARSRRLAADRHIAFARRVDGRRRFFLFVQLDGVLRSPEASSTDAKRGRTGTWNTNGPTVVGPIWCRVPFENQVRPAPLNLLLWLLVSGSWLYTGPVRTYSFSLVAPISFFRVVGRYLPTYFPSPPSSMYLCSSWYLSSSF